MLLDKSNYIEILQQNIASVIRQSSTTASSEEKLTTLQKDLTKFDELLVRRMIEKITVYDECVSVEFKSGEKSILRNKIIE